MRAPQADPRWHHYCRIMLEWLNPRPGLDPERWVAEVVERAQRLHVDTLAFDFYHGGYAIFNGAVAPNDRHVGDADLLALLDQAVHQRGMQLVMMNMGQHCNEYLAEEYPSWRYRDAEGSTPLANFFQSYMLCLNTPYADFLLQELAGLLPRYQIDGLYIEGLYGLDCYCDYCVTEYERTHGYAIPREDEARRRDPRYPQFRAQTMNDFLRRLREVIDTTSPRTVLLPCPSFPHYTDLRTWGRYADAIEQELQWGYQRAGSRKLFEIGMSLQVIRAVSGCHPMGTTWLGWNVDRDYSPCTPEHYRLNFMEILLYGATPQLHAQTIFEVDTSEIEVVREMFALVEQARPTLLDAELLSYAALLVDYSEYNVSDHARGFYQALIEHHVPLRLIARQDLSLESLRRFRVLVLPNVLKLSDDEVSAIRAFHTAGGGVVFTYRTGGAMPDGSLRPEFPLADLAGITGPFGIVTHPAGGSFELLPATYYRITAEHAVGAGTVGRLQSFHGSWAEVAVSTGQVIAHALDYDYTRMHRHHPVFGWYPGRQIAPLIVANEGPAPAGRVVYFAGEFDAANLQAALPGTLDTLAQATVWAAAARPPVEVHCSPTVEIATHYSPSARAYTVLIVNKTTNDITPGMVVRYVEPVRALTITLPDIGNTVKVVRSLTGSPISWHIDENACVLLLDTLREYEALVVELTD